MTRLHKIPKFSFIKKYYLLFFLFICYGIYKNGVLPFIEGYQNITETLRIFLFPLASFIIGTLFDFLGKNRELFNCKFYALLFSLLIPFQTNFWIYLLFLSIILFFYLFIVVKKIDCVLNFIAWEKLILVLFLILFHSYNYQNPLENSGLFQYSFLDVLFGHQISGLFTSNVVLLLFSLFLLGIDAYYKKEIPLYSYGFYIISLVIYSIIKQDMGFILTHFFSSSVLFAFIFIATLSIASPYTKRKKFMYSFFIGSTTLIFSLMTNFYEGVYISIVFANLLFVCLPHMLENHFIAKKRAN